jgi:hypothetical protein
LRTVTTTQLALVFWGSVIARLQAVIIMNIWNLFFWTVFSYAAIKSFYRWILGIIVIFLSTRQPCVFWRLVCGRGRIEKSWSWGGVIFPAAIWVTSYWVS